MRCDDVSVPGRITSRVVIGRADERARLQAALRSASAGSPVTVLVTGEAGIGKTRLVADFAGSVAGEVTVLAGACIDERVPYTPVADALRSLVKSGWEPGDVGERGWGELGALVPELGWPARDRGREGGSPGRLQGAFLQLVEELCHERPVMLVVEDLHWSDASTRSLLMYVMRAAREVPLLLVGTYRSDDLTRRHPLRPFLAEAARVRSGRLSPRLQDILLARTTSLSPAAWSVGGILGEEQGHGAVVALCGYRVEHLVRASP